MAKKKRDPDFNESALSIVKAATGSEPLRTPSSEATNEAAVLLGRLGGLKGAKPHARKLSPEQRSAIARNAGLTSGRSRKKK